MLWRIRRKLILNKRINTVFVFIFFFLITFASIGYSALTQNLMITGDANYYTKTDKLYNVLKRATDVGTYAKEYTGTHQDSISGNGDKKIYYWYGSNATNGTTIQNLNNVIFAGQCWQMIRTTDTGGVKMIYNGKVFSVYYVPVLKKQLIITQKAAKRDFPLYRLNYFFLLSQIIERAP